MPGIRAGLPCESSSHTRVEQSLSSWVPVPRRTIAVAILSAWCGACEVAASWAQEPQREIAPAVLFVRQPVAQVMAAALAQTLLAPPPVVGDGSEARPFPSLGVAVQMAPPGALLRVEEGIWREKLDIERPVVLMGRGASRTRIMPPDGTAVAVEVQGADHVQLYGLSIEGAGIGVRIKGGTGHRLENVELRDLGDSAVVGRQAEIALASCSVHDVALGIKGHGIDIEGGALAARRITLRKAGRRAIVVTGAPARLEDLEVTGSAVAAVQSLDGADVRVLGGEFEGQGGSALYVGAALLSVDGAHVRHDEYGIIAARGSGLSVTGVEITDYRHAGVALVRSHGVVRHSLIARGGTEAAISITFADGKVPVLLVENRIQDPGPMGVHITSSTVTARGNTITGARPDPEKDMGDGFFAIDSRLVVEENVMRGNAGSGVTTLRSKVRLEGNGFIENGRAGMLLLDRSKGTATGNLFQRNAVAAVEVGERAQATLVRNRFEGNPGLDIETGCGKGLSGTADLEAGNTFATPVRRRACAE